MAICRLLLSVAQRLPSLSAPRNCDAERSNPDILMLDEPTNHLDAQSVAWLERFLAEFQAAAKTRSRVIGHD